MARPTTSKRLIDDLPPKERTTPMKVLCLGHLRTGTISLDAALKVLGYKPYHGKALMDLEQMKRELPLWIEGLKLGLSDDLAEKATDSRPKYGKAEFDKIVGEYDALLEPSFLYKDMLEAYPEAKVILTTRSTESWLRSMRSSIFPIAAWDWEDVVKADPSFATPWWEYVKFVMWLIVGNEWKPGMSITPEAEKVAAERYEAHYAGVREVVPKERVMEWNPAEGWKPLCEFLGVQAPFVKEFPRVNDKEEFVKFHENWFAQLNAARDGTVVESSAADEPPTKGSKRCDTID